MKTHIEKLRIENRDGLSIPVTVMDEGAGCYLELPDGFTLENQTEIDAFSKCLSDTLRQAEDCLSEPEPEPVGKDVQVAFSDPKLCTEAAPFMLSVLLDIREALVEDENDGQRVCQWNFERGTPLEMVESAIAEALGKDNKTTTKEVQVEVGDPEVCTEPEDWRNLKEGEVIREGDSFYYGSERQVFPDTRHGEAFTDKTLTQGYRPLCRKLGPEEIIQEGDEVMKLFPPDESERGWSKVSDTTIGNHPSKFIGTFRRRIEEVAQ